MLMGVGRVGFKPKGRCLLTLSPAYSLVCKDLGVGEGEGEGDLVPPWGV